MFSAKECITFATMRCFTSTTCFSFHFNDIWWFLFGEHLLKQVHDGTYCVAETAWRLEFYFIWWKWHGSFQATASRTSVPKVIYKPVCFNLLLRNESSATKLRVWSTRLKLVKSGQPISNKIHRHNFIFFHFSQFFTVFFVFFRIEFGLELNWSCVNSAQAVWLHGLPTQRMVGVVLRKSHRGPDSEFTQFFFSDFTVSHVFTLFTPLIRINPN